MARFRGSVKGGRSEASRLGHKTTWLTVSADGWTDGVTVFAHVDEHGNDRFTIYHTSGSSQLGERKIIGYISHTDGFIPV